MDVAIMQSDLALILFLIELVNVIVSIVAIAPFLYFVNVIVVAAF